MKKLTGNLLSTRTETVAPVNTLQTALVWSSWEKGTQEFLAEKGLLKNEDKAAKRSATWEMHFQATQVSAD